MMRATSVYSCHLAIALAAGLIAVSGARAADLVFARDGSGVYGYKQTPVLPWCGYHVHDPDRPEPPRIDPGPAPARAPIPSDAIVLFEGKDLSAWEPSQWRLVDGEIEAGEGHLVSRQRFGDIQLHVEWLAPVDFEGPWYDRGNNGVMLMGLYEIQIFFTAPRFEGERLVAPARITMLHNGVLVHLNEMIHGETRHLTLPEYRRKTSTGPVMLLGHNCPVRFRSVWVRPLQGR